MSEAAPGARNDASPPPERSPVVFLVDMDNTLIDNDAVKRDLQEATARLLGRERGDRFWAVYEQVRQDQDYVDFPATIERFRRERPEAQRLPEVVDLLQNLPFDRYLYPGALDTLAALTALGPVVILSDGDPVYQPRKIVNSGVARAAAGRVLIFVHKQEELPAVERRHPADHYMLIDDKPSVLADVKRRWGDRVTTVLVQQGQYAHSAAQPTYRPAPDRLAATIADVGRHAAAWFGAR